MSDPRPHDSQPNQPSPPFTDTAWWKRIEAGTATAADLQKLRELLKNSNGQVTQLGKYNVSIGQGQDIQVGNRTYIELNEEALEAIAIVIQQRAQTIQAPAQLNFQPYLQSLINTYQHWQERYTLIDVVGRTKVSASSDTATANPEPKTFDFGLMVQTVVQRSENDSQTKDQQKSDEDESLPEEQQELKEKVERFPVLEGIRKYADDHVLLIGRPGSGKSTALLRLLLEEAVTQRSDALKASDPSRPIPVLVELRYWKNSLLERIQAFLGKQDSMLHLDEEALTKLLRQGRLLLLIDGLNELPSAEARRDVARFAKDFPKAPMIFTTRDLSLGGELGLEKKLEMQPLSEPQMRQFVGNYLGQEKGDRLLQQLQNRLRELGETPLLLAMLCSIFKHPEQNLPTNLGEVFRQFTQFYEQQLKGDVPDPYEHRDDWGKLLQCLAFAMMQGPDPRQKPTELSVAIPQTEAEQILAAFLRNREAHPEKVAERCLQDLLKHHLIQTNGEQIEFRHQLLQEYYAAEALLRQLPNLSDMQLKQNYLNYLKWTEPLALMLVLVDDTTQALHIVKLAMDNVDLMLGARLAGETKSTFHPTTVGWIERKDLPMRLKVQCWEASRSEQAVNDLLTALQDSDFDVRRSAAEALGAIGSERAVEGLLNALQDSDFDVRRSAAEALGAIGSERAVEGLLNALKDSDSDVRWSAAEALGAIGSERAVEGLLNALKDSDSHVRRSAVVALETIGGEQVVEGLLNALKDSDSYVQRSAVEALGTIGGEQAVEVFLGALQHSVSYVRCKAAEALGTIGSERAVDGLLNALKDSGSDVRWSAAVALGSIGSERAVEGLLAALKDSDSEVRRSAAVALGTIGSERAVDGLLNALKDSGSDVRWSAAIALGTIGSERAVEGLLNALQHSVSDVRWSAAIALGTIGSERAVEGLLNALKDSDSYVRRSAIEALGTIGSERAVEGLLTTLKDSVSYIRRSAAIALGTIGSERAVEGLLNALKDSDSEVRRSAAIALGTIGSERAVEGLLNALKDLDSYVRKSIAEALGTIGSERAVDALIRVVQTRGEDMRQTAIKALGKIAADNLLTPLTAALVMMTLMGALQDKYLSVRRNAVAALGAIGNPKPLAELWQQQLASSRVDTYLAITAIQNHCQFYNYEVWQAALQQQAGVEQKVRQGNGQATTIVNIETLHAPNSAINLGGTVRGDQTGTQGELPNP